MRPSSPPAPTRPNSSSIERQKRPWYEPALGAGLALSAAWVSMCTAGGAVEARVGAPVPHAAPPAAVPLGSVSSRPLTPASAASPPTLASPRLASERPRELARFSSALAGLEQHSRAEPVRVLWLGDSHTAADFLTGAVRSSLARRYGGGGPGFVRLGLPSYRHDLAVLNRLGRFKVEPEPPARRSAQGDGVFGLGGIRVVAPAESARMTLKLVASAVAVRARYSLLFDLPPGASFVATLGDESVTVRDGPNLRRVPGTPILRLDLEGLPRETLTIETRQGRPRFYGVVIEDAKPGVVLDTVGIDGARVATALAWAEAPFIAEVAARHPDLVVLAYGTNEAFDELRVEAYDAQLEKLLGRLKTAAPATDCLVLGPPDALTSRGESAPRLVAISSVYSRVAARQGCAFVSLQALMGGPNAFADWQREAPPLASPDRLHLTPRGYRRLGELLALSVFGTEPAVVATNAH